MPYRAAFATLLTLTILLTATACASADWSTPRTEVGVVGAPEPGFIPTPTPTPEATVSPADGSWEGVHPAPGYRVVLLTSDDTAPTKALTDAVEEWAAAEHVDLRRVRADDDAMAGIIAAMGEKPELIVSVGDDLVDPLATVSPNHLDMPFLVLGAELAEPTYNVTAVDWNGAGFRGEGLGTATHFDEGSFTAQRCAAAIRAGAAAVLTGLTGVVLWID